MSKELLQVVNIEEVCEPMLGGNEKGQTIKYVFHTVQKEEKKDESDSVATADTVDSSEDVKSDEADRGAWGGKLEFIFTCIGYAVGLGNVWRFPYLCYKNGGGAFLIPYVIMLAAVGLPLFYMELAFGQFASLGPISIWRINPLLKGLGYSMVIVSWLISLYYNVIIAHTLFYLGASMTPVLPWTTCGNTWNTNSCLSHNFSDSAVAPPSHPSNVTFNTPAEEYYKYFVLEQNDNIGELGSVNWKLALCLLAAWVIVGACLIRGIQSLGKVVYFTAVFPYIMLTILLIRGVTLDGALDGIIYYLKPDFSRLGDPRVWSDAATQIFYSLSTCTGGLITMSSFNKFRNNCYKDSLIVALINCATSIFAGLVIFSILGFMAKEKGVSVADVADGGPGLAFVVYPEAISRMPVSPLWAVFFFLMMATLGFGSQFSMVECVMSAFIDEFRSSLPGKLASTLFRVGIVVVGFLLGLPMVCKGGIYLLNLVDYSVGGFPLLVVGLIEIVALNWIYKFERFSEDIEMMLGKKPNLYWQICWKFVSPIVIGATIIFNIVLYKNPSYETAPYPVTMLAAGWMIVMFPIVTVPIYFMYKYCVEGGFSLLVYNMSPIPQWGPCKLEDRMKHSRYAPSEVKVDDIQKTRPTFLFGSNASTMTADTRLSPVSSVLNSRVSLSPSIANV
ncbi:sodium- and chloride-dependent glycine transporter 1-like [Haliotis rufescens]|uniref:sodium- and chloride-dependent glycine transporter 1-like n=1 Tax=Haliotis rufescens TaxID=6454 RepID=UPI001EAFC08F|nr:sodium- and chloride-dependent glycine transporter 1-like [Haliotis rufescens]